MVRGKSLKIQVQPDVLKWAIKNSGLPENQIANKIKVNIDTLNDWLSGTKKPTLRQLESLSQILKRPLAAFFLSKPPEEKPLPRDYRMIPDKIGKFNNKTILAIRKARRLQRVSKELSENLKTEMETGIPSVNLSDNPNLIAEKYLEIFKINEETRKKWKSPYDALNYFRNILEDRNIVVFKISMPIEDARGFTLVEEVPPVIVVNSKDLPEAQVFTLLHEFGHVLLNKSGVSMPDNALFQREVNKVEKWCNEFASAILLPEDVAKTTFERNKEDLIETQTLNRLSRKLKISKAMLLYNMSKFNYITKSQYELVLKRYDPTQIPTKKEKKKKGGGGVSADKKCISEKGQMFVSLVSKNVNEGFITRSDALDYLSIKSQNLEKVMSQAIK
ncbi:MAG: ImmA/IrrE family metallo-endopeptidase [Nanoarchaeota archaeon]|nr:ImmA/IrrE family metallo-endopeptidase [Nanoarchaeota archaeon]